MIFEGDIKLFNDPDYKGIKFINGQPVMTGGIDNAVLISLGTKKGWWGNYVIKDLNTKVGSDYEDEVSNGVINMNKIAKVRTKAIKALSWMIDEGLAKKVDSEPSNPYADRIDNTIMVTRDNNVENIFEVNWDNQFLENR